MKKRKYMLSYTLLYIALALGVWVYFWGAEKSLINTSDAYKQHINALMVYGKWLRSIAYGIFHGDFSLKNYSFGIGYGADFYTSMQYYAVGDILNLPVAFIKTGAVYYYFQFLIILRPYLAGLSFTALCAHKGKGKYKTEALLTGALSYAFCGTVMFIGMWNPFFVNAMIILPLMILGADKVLEGESARLFVLSVAISAVTNFYFFYMCVVLTIGYVIISLCFIRKNVLKTIGIFWGCGFLGTAMSAVVFLPVVLAFLSNPRAGLSGHGVRALYEADYYKELIKNLITYIYKPMYDTELGFTFIAVPVLVYVLCRTKKDLKSTILLIVMTAMLAIPYAGYSMTGFSYMINRWSFAVELFFALKITEFISELGNMEINDRIVLAAGQGIYVLLLVFTGFVRDEEVKVQILLLVAGIILLFIPVVFKEKSRKAAERVLSFGLMILVIAGVLLNGYFANAENKGNLPNGYLEKTTAEGFLEDYENTEVKAVNEVTGKSADDYIRYTGRNLSWNAGMLDGMSSTQFYFSLANGAISDYMNKLAINEMSDFSYYGLDNRMAPLALSGVNTYTLRYDNPEEEAYVPADYKRAGNYFNYAVFTARNPITLGYTCDNVIDGNLFEEMSPVMRQDAMLSGVLTGEASDYSPEYSFNAFFSGYLKIQGFKAIFGA
nr:YfhO family protein [Butyrivibrio sp.]